VVARQDLRSNWATARAAVARFPSEAGSRQTNRAMNQAIVARFAASACSMASREGTECGKSAGPSGNESGNGCRIPWCGRSSLEEQPSRRGKHG
jgi:hypothetical protein